jgi:hypothetical protein
MQLQHSLQIAVAAIAAATIMTVAPLYRKNILMQLQVTAIIFQQKLQLQKLKITDTTIIATPFAK